MKTNLTEQKVIIMSEKKMQGNLEQFLQMVSQNLEMQEKLKAAPDREAYVRSVVELGKEKGYNFTSDRVQATLDISAKQAEENGELILQLSEQELELVAGGDSLGCATIGSVGFWFYEA